MLAQRLQSRADARVQWRPPPLRGVDRSSPEEGSYESPAIRRVWFFFRRSRSPGTANGPLRGRSDCDRQGRSGGFCLVGELRHGRELRLGLKRLGYAWPARDHERGKRSEGDDAGAYEEGW